VHSLSLPLESRSLAAAKVSETFLSYGFTTCRVKRLMLRSPLLVPLSFSVGLGGLPVMPLSLMARPTTDRLATGLHKAVARPHLDETGR